jgi:protein TonB
MIRDRSERARRTGLVAMSTATHILVFTGLGFVPSPSEVLARREMEFEVVEPPKPAPPPPPEPEIPPEPEKPEPARPRHAKAEPEPEEAPEPETPPADATSDEPVADFTGETLVAEGGVGGWSTRVGSGAPLRGPVGKIGDPTGATGPPGPTGPRVVAAEDLERRPAPPAGMDPLLETNYPKRARLQGVEGSVLLRVRILPDGRLGAMTVLRETPEGWDFAEACRKTLRDGGRWERPIGRGGAPVATDVKYACRFEVD